MNFRNDYIEGRRAVSLPTFLLLAHLFFEHQHLPSLTMLSTPAPVIYLNGFPGSGKLTIALAMQALIPDSKVLDNHSLIDPVEQFCRRGTAYYFSERGEYRRAMLKPIAEDPALRDIVHIFTDCQTGNGECMVSYGDEIGICGC